MSYSYRPSQAKITTPPSNIKPAQTQQTKQLSKQELKTFESVFLIIGYLLRSNQSRKIKQSFSKIKSHVTKKKKYSQLLSKKINFLFKSKHKQFTNIFFSSLVANRITFYNTQMASHQQLKESTRNKALAIVFLALHKFYNRRFLNAFKELKSKSLAYSKAKIFKTTHIFARLSLAYRNKLQGAFNRMVKNRGLVLRKGKVFVRLQNFISVKNKSNICAAFNRFKISLYRSKLGQAAETQAAQPAKRVEPKHPTQAHKTSSSGSNKMEVECRQLEKRSRQLQTQLLKIEKSGNRTISNLTNEIEKLQKQSESLKFTTDLIEQNNCEMQRQIQTKQFRGRRKLPRNQVWQGVYNNLIYFLALNRDSQVSKQQLIQCLQTPLVPCSTDLEQLNEENSVLAQLLSEYRKSFPEPQFNQANDTANLLPYDLLKKQNRYYYLVLEVLSEWALSGSRQLQQLNQDLQILQNKLVE